MCRGPRGTGPTTEVWLGELPVCEQVCKIGEWKSVGTSERGGGRMSVDTGMWVKKSRGGREAGKHVWVYTRL